MASDNKAWYVEQEKRAAKCVADDDPDYENTLMRSSSSD